MADRVAGVVSMPRMPVVGTTWTLQDVLPRRGDPYRGTVEQVWREKDGRLRARFAMEDGIARVFEVWLGGRA